MSRQDYSHKARGKRATRLLFLDIDGVLNGHEALESGYCGISHERASILNRVLSAVPDVQIVVSSAWRYMILEGAMTLKGFSYVLSMHGVLAYGRMHGHTDADVHPDEQPDHFDRETWKRLGLTWRAEQIRSYLSRHPVERWAVIDDLPLEIENLVQTDGNVGLTDADAERLIAILTDGATH